MTDPPKGGRGCLMSRGLGDVYKRQVMHLYNILEFFLLLLSIPYLYFFLNLVLINRRNGPRYQRVLALCAFSTGVIPKGLILRKFCV